jgi:hypothetical protein
MPQFVQQLHVMEYFATRKINSPHAWLLANKLSLNLVKTIDILYTLDSACNYSAIEKLKP